MIPVLMYHHISPLPGPHTVTPDMFRDHLRRLSERGIRTLSLDEFSAWRKGELELREPSVVLTFDDAWLDNWVYALPALEEFGARATFFVVTSWPGVGPPRSTLISEGGWEAKSHSVCMELAGGDRRDEVLMRWSELLASRETGVVDLACHSHTHGRWWDTGNSWAKILEGLEADLADSCREMTEKTGKCSPHWCWPKGLFSHEAIRLASRYGFSSQFSTMRGGNARGEFTLVRRINAENRPSGWLNKQLSIYSNPILGQALGLAHQQLQGKRMKARFQAAPPGEFSFPLLRPV